MAGMAVPVGATAASTIDAMPVMIGAMPATIAATIDGMPATIAATTAVTTAATRG